VEAIPLSDPSNIIVISAATPNIPFLVEQKHTWCYFYAKAELAYQERNWKKVIELVDEAVSLGYGPEDPFEWLAYVEAQARMGNFESAQELSNTVLALDKSIRKGLCEVWKRVQAEGPARNEFESTVRQILTNMECSS